METPMKHILRSTPSTLIATGVMALVILLGGCATAQPPSSQVTTALATASETVNQAREVDAQQYAPLELQMAESKMQAAQLALAKNDNERAGRLANEAMVDARLASIKSRSAKTQAVVLELQQSIETLREEIGRNKKG
jgi:multidrug resistance efflux pump